MGGGIYNAVLVLVHSGKILAILIIECEVKHLHSGEACIVEKLNYVLCDKTEVLCNNLRLGETLSNGAEESNAGSRIPFTVFSGGLAVGNVVIACKSAEVVDSENIVELICKTYSVDPPGEAILFHKRPVVDGVTPELTVRRESIGGTACNNCGIVIFIKQELLGSCPNVHRVVSNVDRHIADDEDATLMSVRNNLLPLSIKFILNPAPEAHLCFEICLSFHSLLVVAMLLAPKSPLTVVVMNLKGHEESVIFKPGFVLLYESSVCGSSLEAAVCRAKCLISCTEEPAVINELGVLLLLEKLLLCEKSLCCKNIEVNEVRVSCYGGG